MKVLFLTYFFEPDLCAGSFRNTSLFNVFSKKIKDTDTVDVITTHPNRYDSYRVEADDVEKRAENITINRIKIPEHNSGLLGQIKSFKVFYTEAKKIAKNGDYDLVYASSSKMFTAFLGAKLARKFNAKLYLDIRDIFREGIKELFKNPLLKIALDIFLRPVEAYTFGRANHINLVSKGFQSYFEKYNCPLSFYTNGIDDVFIDNVKPSKSETKKEVRTIVYAGNIGEGQGLNIVIPEAAKQLGANYKFVIFGDGGTKQRLLNKIEELNLTNVEVKNPVNRKLLLEQYQNADYLFLHLNKFKAFERVLPSKLFEYGTFDKPIIAGVGGYAAEFLKEEMSNLILFDPGDVDSFVSQLRAYNYTNIQRKEFIEKFSRSTINLKMADSILSL